MGGWLGTADVLAARNPQPWERDWLARHSEAFRDRIKADPFAAALAQGMRSGRWLPVDLSLPPRPGDVSDPAGAFADLVQWTWEHTVQVDWPRRKRKYEADIIGRTTVLSEHGWAAAIGGIAREVRWLGDGQLQIAVQDLPPVDLGARIVAAAARPDPGRDPAPDRPAHDHHAAGGRHRLALGTMSANTPHPRRRSARSIALFGGSTVC